MGASSSSFAISGSDNQALKVRLGDIPESCIALVLAYLDPPEICNLARLNRAFHGASSADFIWETKLPPNYRCIAEKLCDEAWAVWGRRICTRGSVDPIPSTVAPRRFGSRRVRVGFVCRSLRRLWRLRASMIGDTGSAFRPRNLDSRK
ncbi:F-box protein like [Actinidia chinensis var. chinensis]|uniref:F-box protein like n=1 Tax=Actinidia chinensis var. chinensis TaxID=1590841 RepID=A0A2R6R9Y4_ACTCC|nr:F-box protein like [Actinidia chinensis var. chinensis]